MKVWHFILIGFAIGFLCGGLTVYWLYPDCPEIRSQSVEHSTYTSVTTDKETTDFNLVETTTPAKFEYEKRETANVKSETPNLTVEDYQLPGYEKIAKWDSTGPDGFYASIRYYTEQEKFENKFSFPYKSRTIETTINENKSKETINTIEVDKSLGTHLAIGYRSVYTDKVFIHYPVAGLEYNDKFWLINYTVKIKTLINYGTTSLKLTPEFEAGIRIKM